MIGDLHCHTRCSDSSAEVRDVVCFAKAEGIDVLAITDHDTMMGVPEAQKLAEGSGLTILPGVELSSMDPATGRRVHILCYLPKEVRHLEPLFETMAQRRREAGEQMIEKVRKYYPLPQEHLDRYLSKSASIFRVHIMQVLIDMGYDIMAYGELYHELFRRDSEKSCFVPIEYPSVYEVLDAVHRARGIAVMAHPSVYHSVELLRELAKKKLLQGVELTHPRNTPQDREAIREIAAQYGLLTTGGSDFHGCYDSKKVDPLGTCTTSDAELRALYRAAEEL